VLGIGRATAYREGKPRGPRYAKADDRAATAQIREIIRTRATYGLEPITTPKASPQSNGMAEAFVNTLKRDYVSGADRSEADGLLDQAALWIEDYNAIAPHSALGYRSAWQHRSEGVELV
jgi:transposase InsO family protein